MTQTQTMTAVGYPASADSDNASDASLTTIVQAVFADTVRSSGSLESNGSASTSSTAPSVPSLDTSHSTVSESSTTSLASSKAPSPCPSILRSSSAPPQDFPTSSASSSPNVTFAPLPQTEQRKRHPSHQLGVAARSRLLRHRRMLREGRVDPDDPSYHQYGPGSGIAGGKGAVDTYGPDGENVQSPSEGHGEMGEGEEGYPRRRRSRAPSEPQEDPLVALGRLMKGATKTLWRSLSMRDMRVQEREDGQAVPDGAERQEGRPASRSRREKRSAPPRVGAVHLFEDDEGRHVSDEGGVWEEEVSEESLKKLLSKPPLPAADAAQDAEPHPRYSAESTDSVRTTTVTVTATAQSSTAKAR
ncbi:hypothetical protein BD311DRAFT_1779 [Dichomitus squalens]|uniref:Uncharacterized protein n=1 Tax=Dichomitus squalens TaxID=114155 RepID=A0A4Q9N5W3_9APHY|nr:hypothetical protein BD311DRAFT_1779 [Dichomitus squalens]